MKDFGFFWEDFLKIIFLHGEIFEFSYFFFCLKMLLKVNGKVTVWHTPCCLLFIPLHYDPPRLYMHIVVIIASSTKASFYFPLNLPLWWCPLQAQIVHNKTQSVFVQHQDVSGHHQDTSWSDKRAVKRAVQKRWRQKFLYCLQIRTTYVHKLYLPLMFHKSCQNNNNNFEKNKSLAAPIWIFQNFDNN